MNDAELSMIETLPAVGCDGHGEAGLPEAVAVMTYPTSGVEAEDAMTCPAAHLDALAPSGITFCPNDNPGEFPSEYPEDNDPTLLPCTICNRTFNPQALERHRKVCEKLSTKRRKTFNSTKQRVDGLDVAPSLPTRGKSPESKAQQSRSKSKWREKHKEFLRAIRAAKGMEDENDGGEGPPASNVPSDYVQCPQCERHFGPKAADRHIEWCKEKATRMPKSHTNSQAAERLKTRTKYAPPKPGQNGWRAPKKSDVISSIPPPSSGSTPTPGAPLGAREFSPPSNRQMSPPRSLARQTSPPLPTGRHLSPPPMTSSRRTSISSVASLGRSGSLSLGRSAGKQLSAMLSSGYGSSPSYGTSSGYGQSSKYGQQCANSQYPQYGLGGGSSLSRTQTGRSSFSGGVLPLVRQGSVRSSLRRSSPSTPMARHRDLASDMMASVCISPDPKRGEPEGDEAGEIFPACSSSLEASFSKLDDVAYDPFSAAELQMQSLMGLSKPSSSKGTGLGAAGLGSGISMIESLRLEGIGRESPDFSFDIGLEEFEKEYQSTRTPSLGYSSPKLRIRSDIESSGKGLGKRSDSLIGLNQEQTTGSAASDCAGKLDWSWKVNPSSSFDQWNVLAISPPYKNSSCEAPIETRHYNRNQLSSESQENISNDSRRCSSSAHEPFRDSRSWSSPSRDNTWMSLAHDINSWSASNQGNDSLSIPSSRSSKKSSPVREIQYQSPDRRSHGTSPTHDSQSSAYDTNRFSSPTHDSLGESSALSDTLNSSPTNDAHTWSSAVHRRYSPSRDNFKAFIHDNSARPSFVIEQQKDSFTMDTQGLSSPTQGRCSRFSRTYDVSKDKESNLGSDKQKEILPSLKSQRMSSPPQKSNKDSSFGFDACSWSSPPRERLSELPPTYDCFLEISEKKKESPTFNEMSPCKSTIEKKQKDSSVGRIISAERPTRDTDLISSCNMRTRLGDRRSVSPVRDTNRWTSSMKDDEVVSAASNFKSQSGWSIGEPSTGLSPLSKYLGGSSINSRQSTAFLSTSDEAYKKKSGVETYQATHDSFDSDMKSAKKDTDRADDSHLRVSSGSSSDSSSLPPLSSSPILSTSATGNHTRETGSSTSAMKMPRFCHECGHKYPVLLAKFCCHCGSRRPSVDN